MLRLTFERLKRNWTKLELTRRSKVSPGDLSKIESGRLIPYDSQLKKLAQALNIPTNEFSKLMEEVEMDFNETKAA